MYNFVKKFIKIIVTFLSTFLIATIASDNQNKVYTFLENHGYADITIKKAVLSALIVATIEIIKLVLELLVKLILLVINNYFKRLFLEVSFKVKGRKKDIIKFKPKNYQYDEQLLDIEIIVTPAGRILMYVLKFLEIYLEIFFNPQILDVSLVDDKKWMDEKTPTRSFIDSQTVCIGVLNEFRLGGNSEDPFRITEKIILIPKRVKGDTTNINLRINTKIGSKFGIALCEFQSEKLLIECEGRN